MKVPVMLILEYIHEPKMILDILLVPLTWYIIAILFHSFAR